MSIRTTLMNAASGLAASSAGIAATSHNVANATTPGYSRRGVALSTRSPIVGALVIGQGVNVDGFTRAANDRLVEQQVHAGSDLAGARTRGDALRSLESYFDPVDGTGPRTALSAFYDSLGAAGRDPADPGLRRDVVASGQTLARTLNRTSSALSASEAAQTSDIGQAVDDLNAILHEVAAINVEIVAAGGPLRSGDLADRRDELMRQAGQIGGVELDIQGDGTATGLIGGHVVVSGVDVRPVRVEDDGTLSVPVGKGSVSIDTKVGGVLGGLNDARSTTRALRTELDTAVVAVADAMNTTHAAGYDATGAAGGPLFAYDPSAPGATISFAVTDGSALAFAGAATAYAGDGDNLTALTGLENTALVGSRTGSQAFTALSTELGTVIRSTDADAAHADAILMDLDELTASLSGVDLDEEAATLLTYQASYQAAAKVIQTSDQMMGVLMDMV